MVTQQQFRTVQSQRLRFQRRIVPVVRASSAPLQESQASAPSIVVQESAPVVQTAPLVDQRLAGFESQLAEYQARIASERAKLDFLPLGKARNQVDDTIQDLEKSAENTRRVVEGIKSNPSFGAKPSEQRTIVRADNPGISNTELFEKVTPEKARAEKEREQALVDKGLTAEQARDTSPGQARAIIEGRPTTSDTTVTIEDGPAVRAGYDPTSYAALSPQEKRDIDNFYRQNPSQQPGAINNQVSVLPGRARTAGELLPQIREQKIIPYLGSEQALRGKVVGTIEGDTVNLGNRPITLTDDKNRQTFIKQIPLSAIQNGSLSDRSDSGSSSLGSSNLRSIQGNQENNSIFSGEVSPVQEERLSILGFETPVKVSPRAAESFQIAGIRAAEGPQKSLFQAVSFSVGVFETATLPFRKPTDFFLGIKESIFSPIQTTKSLVGQVRAEPERTFGQLAGSSLFFKSAGKVVSPISDAVVAGVTQLRPSFRPVIKEGAVGIISDIPTTKGLQEIRVVGRLGGAGLPDETLAQQASRAGTTTTAVSGARDLFGTFKREIVVDKPLPTPNAPPIERSFFADPAARLRPSRLGLTEAPAAATVNDLIAGNVQFRNPRPQAIIFPEVTIQEFPSSLSAVRQKLLQNRVLSTQEESALLRFQMTPSGQFKPVGFLSKEPEITIPPGEVVRQVRGTGAVTLLPKQGSRFPVPVDILEAEIVSAKNVRPGDVILGGDLSALGSRRDITSRPVSSRPVVRPTIALDPVVGLLAKKVSSDVVSSPTVRLSVSVVPVSANFLRVSSRSSPGGSSSPPFSVVSPLSSPGGVSPRVSSSPRQSRSPSQSPFTNNSPSPLSPGSTSPSSSSMSSTSVSSSPSPSSSQSPSPISSPSPFRSTTPFSPFTPSPTVQKLQREESVKKQRSVKERKLVEAFDLFIKRGGKFSRIGSGLTKEQATLAGSRAALGSLAATFQLRKTGELVEERSSARADLSLFRTFKIVNQQAVPLTDTFIQKRGARLTTQAERSQIQAARKQSSFFRSRKPMEAFL